MESWLDFLCPACHVDTLLLCHQPQWLKRVKFSSNPGVKHKFAITIVLTSLHKVLPNVFQIQCTVIQYICAWPEVSAMQAQLHFSKIA